MKITDVRVRLFEMPMPRPFHPTWEPFPTVKARLHVVEIHTDEGITGKIAAMVESHGLVFTPHTWTNGIGMAANLHCAAASANVPYVEFPHDPPNWTPAERDFMLKEPLTIDAEGYVALPRAPGLGVEIDEDKAKRYEKTRTA